MIVEAIERILQDCCTPSEVRAIEAGGSPATLWSAFEGSGFLDLLEKETAGGAGLSMRELFPVVQLLGRYAVPLPVGHTIISRAITGSRLQLPSGMLTLSTALARDAGGQITCIQTPYGLLADHVLAQDGNDILLLPSKSAHREPAAVRGSMVATLVWPDDRLSVRVTGVGEKVRDGAAALHAGLISGAIGRVLELTMSYCNDRVQFGKPLNKFQAVQHQQSVMAEHAAAASLAAEAAFQWDPGMPSFALAAAMAKARTSEAAAVVANAAHALHGAIGMTEEYDLQLLTRRLHEWRMAHGSEAYWNRRIGEQILGSASTLVEIIRSI